MSDCQQFVHVLALVLRPGNKIGCNGARAVAQMLQVNSTIQHLNLYSTSHSFSPAGTCEV